ncbi:MAG: hypothetical protein MJZ06_05725 [Bacteroidaceae bacterium]|nr:hypothetical protein [Bacteroidaceae bacterium]
MRTFRGMAAERQGLSGVKKRGCLSGQAASSAFQPERPKEQAMERQSAHPTIHHAKPVFNNNDIGYQQSPLYFD